MQKMKRYLSAGAVLLGAFQVQAQMTDTVSIDKT